MIADTSVWIEYLKGTDSDIGQRLDDLLGRREVVIVGVVLAEILQGTTGDRDHARLESALEAAPYLEATRDAWVRAGRISRELRVAGQMLPIIDTVIAAMAIEGDHELFTLDSDFDRISGLRLYDWRNPDA